MVTTISYGKYHLLLMSSKASYCLLFLSQINEIENLRVFSANKTTKYFINHCEIWRYFFYLWDLTLKELNFVDSPLMKNLWEFKSENTINLGRNFWIYSCIKVVKKYESCFMEAWNSWKSPFIREIHHAKFTSFKVVDFIHVIVKFISKVGAKKDFRRLEYTRCVSSVIYYLNLPLIDH